MPRPESWLGRLPPPTPVASGGIQLSARILGRGPRLVLLHGGPGLDHHYLLPLAVALGESYEVVVPDLPGHGASARVGVPMPALRGFRVATLAWLAGLEPVPTALVGHSLGAWLALEALRDGERSPCAVVLLAPPAPVTGPPAGNPVAQDDRRRGVSRSVSTAALQGELLDILRADTGCPPTAALIEAVRDSRLRPASEQGTLRSELQRALARPMFDEPPSAPVLVVVGERDPMAAGTAAHLRRAGTRATLVVLPEEGHFVGVRAPNLVAEIVSQFVASSRGKRTPMAAAKPGHRALPVRTQARRDRS